MDLKLFNVLGREEQKFLPLKPGEAAIYACGPTVYDQVHLGNWRTFIFGDLLRRTLLYHDYRVKYVMNITDVDDKIIARANESGLAPEELAQKYAAQFFADRDKLNILPAHIYPKATENIPAMIELIERLMDKGLAYERDGSVYYEIDCFPQYGKLSGLEPSSLKAGARVQNDEYNKEAPGDFALWKAAKTGELSWSSPWGKGRPGWHIECSAMSMKELGETFDLHLGGVDLIFPHHENEIAQSKGATGKPLARFWLESEHLLVANEKMSKSLKNIFTLETLAEKSYSPLAYRYLTLTTHYRKVLNFTWESLNAAQIALTKLEGLARETTETGTINQDYKNRFMTAISNDLNTPQALAVIWELISDKNIPDPDKKATLLDFDQVLGLGLANLAPTIIPAEIKKLVEERELARKAGDFTKSDKLREQISALGFTVEDSPTGPKIKKE